VAEMFIRCQLRMECGRIVFVLLILKNYRIIQLNMDVKKYVYLRMFAFAGPKMCLLKYNKYKGIFA